MPYFINTIDEYEALAKPLQDKPNIYKTAMLFPEKIAPEFWYHKERIVGKKGGPGERRTKYIGAGIFNV